MHQIVHLTDVVYNSIRFVILYSGWYSKAGYSLEDSSLRGS
jgi:hypothetical protein